MSGTSIDSIDAVLASISDHGLEIQATLEHPIAPAMRQTIADISQPGDNEIERMGVLDRELGAAFAEACNALLQRAKVQAADVLAIGSHGQTIRHRPPSAGNGTAFTLQIGDPNTIAERTGITTVADFRRRDVAAGGEGAPLAPAFHAAVFAKMNVNRAIINIGGIANISLLAGDALLTGYDTGPGNTLLDHWVHQHRGERYDRDGAWSAEGTVHKPLLEKLGTHPYLACRGPRSTGKEAFNMAWLTDCLGAAPEASPQDVQATLAEFTAQCIADSILDSELPVHEAYVCGGGAYNTDLMRRLYRRLQPAELYSTAELGLEPEWVEGAAFAWLAWRTLYGTSGNAAAVTGAEGARVLGGIYPGAEGLRR
jgi:anhydro-N-acetylmuramic acid kinase